MRAIAAVIVWSVVACGLNAVGGCGPRFGRVDVSPGEVPDGAALPDASAVVEAFAPVRIEVHPLSRLEGAGGTGEAGGVGGPRAVVHVQVLDSYGHDTKWPGFVRVEVTEDGGLEGESESGSGGVPPVHFIDLTSGESNARAFDSISRCYVVRVPAPGEHAVRVRVRWLLLDGTGRMQAMEATGVLQQSK